MTSRADSRASSPRDGRYLASCGASGATVVEATAKETVTETLRRSPGHLNAAMMAVWACDHQSDGIDESEFWAMEI